MLLLLKSHKPNHQLSNVKQVMKFLHAPPKEKINFHYKIKLSTPQNSQSTHLLFKLSKNQYQLTPKAQKSSLAFLTKTHQSDAKVAAIDKVEHKTMVLIIYFQLHNNDLLPNMALYILKVPKQMFLLQTLNFLNHLIEDLNLEKQEF